MCSGYTTHNMNQNIFKEPIIFSIEGNIGAGKTTQLKQLLEIHPEYNYVDEPVDTWMSLKDDNEQNLLELFYKDMNRWSYTLQNCAFITRYTSLMNKVNDYKQNPSKYKSNVFITERSVLTDRYVFAEMLKDNKHLQPLEWSLYTMWFDYFIKDIKIHGLIYIQANPNLCKERIGIRNRDGEENIQLDYLFDLQSFHDKWIDNTNIKVLKVTSDINDIPSIVNFIHS